MISFAYAALWIFVFSLPWENLTASSGVNVISRLMGVVAAGLMVLAVVISGRIRRWHVFHVAALLFVSWSACCLLIFQQKLPLKFWTFLQLALVLWIIWELAPSKGKQLGLMMAYVFGTYVASFGTILLYRREGSALRRFAVGGGDANTLAVTLALALPMAWYLSMTFRRPLLRWICRAYLPVGIVAIGLTGSRGGMLVSMIALLIVPLTMTNVSPAKLATVVVVLGISGALAVVFIPDKIVQRLATTGTQVEELSFGGRFTIWVAALRAFAQKPVMGYGTGGFRGAVAPFGVDQVAHNSYLSVLVEEGMVGLILFLGMFAAVFQAALNLPRLERRFALILLATLGVAMLPLTMEDYKQVWFVFAAVLGLAKAQMVGMEGTVRRVLPSRPAPLGRPVVVPRRLEPMTAPRRNVEPGATP
jgi:exopolysaccharide production protein ExoQ